MGLHGWRGLGRVFGVAVWMLLGSVPGVAMAGGAATLVQEHFRWRNDDGGEAGATWKAGQDTAITGVARGQNIRLRFDIANTSTSYSMNTTPALYFSTSTSGPWTLVSSETNGLTPFEMTPSGNFAHGDATTALLPGSGTFVAGKMVEYPNNAASSVTINTNQYSNFEYCFRPTSKARGSTTYYFQVNGMTTYSRYPALTMAAGEANEAPAIVSALSANASVVTNFNYLMLATGSEPISLGVADLPGGLLFDGTNRIRGLATAGGTYQATLTAANAWGSDVRTLTINVLDNVPPVASNQTASVAIGGEIQIDLGWTDDDQPQLLAHTFSILTPPSRCTLVSYFERNGATNYPNRYYLRATNNYTGADSLTWKCNDGKADSNVGTLSINISPNTVPVANNGSASVQGGTQYNLNLSVTDPDLGQARSFSLVSVAAHGTVFVNETSGTASYKSEPAYAGTDRFLWKVNDGFSDSNIGTYSITVASSIPSPQAMTVCVAKDGVRTFPASFGGGGGYTLSLQVRGPTWDYGPKHGSVSVSNLCFTYRPLAGYEGQDTFQWRMGYSNATTTATNTAWTTCQVYTMTDTGLDWPNWRGNAKRTAATLQTLPEQLFLQWRRDYRPTVAEIRSLGLYSQWERAFFPIVVSNRMYVALGGAGCLAALDTATGAEMWRFYSGGAMRMAPAAHRTASDEIRVCVGSDDGWLYCLNGADGTIVWKKRPGYRNRAVFAYNRLASVWPVWGGAVVADGKVYCGAGVWPTEGLFAMAVDVETGAELWKNDTMGMTSFWHEHTHGFGGPPPSGSFVLSAAGTELFFPCGYYHPAKLSRSTGKLNAFAGAYYYSAETTGWYVDSNYAEGALPPPFITAGDRTYSASDATAYGASGTIGDMLIGDGKLFAVTTAGSIYCFGPAQTTPHTYTVTTTPLTDPADCWSAHAATVLAPTGDNGGCAYVLGAGSGRLAESLVSRTTYWRVAVLEPDRVKADALRARFDGAGVLGKRVDVVCEDIMSLELPKYSGRLILAESLEGTGWVFGQAFVGRLLKTLRPYGGAAWLPTTASEHAALAGYVAAAGQAGVQIRKEGDFSVIERIGALPGTVNFADGSYSLNNPDQTVTGVLGLQWYGGGARPRMAIVNGLLTGGYDVYTGLSTRTAEASAYPSSARVDNYHSSFYATRNNPFLDVPETRGRPIVGGCVRLNSSGAIGLGIGGTLGWYDNRLEGGTVYWGGQRYGCQMKYSYPCAADVSVGNGVMYSFAEGCKCGKSGQVPLTMSPRNDDPDMENWAAWQGERSNRLLEDQPVKRVGFNLGAPYCRKDEETLWTPGGPFLVERTGTTASYRHHSSRIEAPDEKKWIYASGMKGMASLRTNLRPELLVAARAVEPPVLDGILNDACWDGQFPVEMVLGTSLRDALVYVRRDADNLYICGRRTTTTANNGWGDDPRWRFLLSDRMHMNGGTYLRFEVQKTGSRVELRRDDDSWTCDWQAAAVVDTTSFTAEVCIPLSVLEAEGLDLNGLVFNCIAATWYGGSCAGFRSTTANGDRWAPLFLDAPKGLQALSRPYTVRLYFADTESTSAGQRIFDVKLQGQTILSNFDIVAAAGGPNRGVMREFTGVLLCDSLQMEFVAKVGEPIISGIELTGEYDAADFVPNLAPEATVTATPASGDAPLTVELSGVGSVDPDGQIVLYEWSFGDGASGTGLRVQHTYAAAGTYQAALRVTDDRGGTAVAQMTVTAAGVPPADFTCTIRASGGDFAKLSAWEAAIQSDLTSRTRLFAVSDAGTYATSDNGKGVTFASGGAGTLLWMNASSNLAAIYGCSGTTDVGTVTIASSAHTFTVSDAGTETSSRVFGVSSRGSYDPAVDNGKAVVFAGGGAGTLRHISLAGMAYITECHGVVGAGVVTCVGGHTFAVADAGATVVKAIAECYNDWPTGLVDSVTIDGWRVDANRCVKIVTPASERHNGKPFSAGVTNYSGFAMVGSFSLPVSYTRLEGLIVMGNISAPDWTGGSHWLDKCIVYRGGVSYGSTGGTKISNCMIIDAPYDGIKTGQGVALRVLNTTVVGSARHGFCGGGQSFLRNVLCTGSRTGLDFSIGNFYGTLDDAAYCASEDTSLTNSIGRPGNRISQTFRFVDSASKDYHLAVDDSGARDRGISVQFDPVMPLVEDVDGEIRDSAPDMGADEVFGSSGVDTYGIPDAWKIQYFGSATATNADAMCDADGDGMTNLGEWKSGTVPTNAVSVLKFVQAAQGGTDLVVSWHGVAGKFYTIQKSTNLLTGFNIPLVTGVPGFGGANTQTVQVDQAQGYFRVKVE